MMKPLQQLLTGALVAGLTTAATAETVRIAYPNWAEGIAMTNLAAVILEEDLGYDVELTQADPGLIYADVASGGQDLFLDAWLPVTHADYWEQYGDQLENLGTTFPLGITGLVVPAYVDIESIEDLNSIKDELNGQITGIGTGAGITAKTNLAIEEYGLDLVQVNSSGPAMTAALANAIEEGKPIVVTGWMPHVKFLKYDLKILKDPKGIYPIDNLRKVARPGFSEDMPEVADFLKNFSLTQEQLLSLMLAIDESDADAYDVAADWARENATLVASWLPRL